MIKIENIEVTGWEHAIRGMRNPMNSWGKSDSGYKDVSLDFDLKAGKQDFEYEWEFIIGPNDLKLMKNLAKAGTDHRKFMRFIDVYLDITAPLYWWKEFDTYRAGVAPGGPYPDPMDIEMNSCSTMHKIHSKEFELDDFSHEHILTDEYLGILEENRIVSGDIPHQLLCTTISFLNGARLKYLETKDKKYWWQMIQLLPSSYNQKRTVKLNYEVLNNMYKARRSHKLDEWRIFCDWIKALPYSELITGEDKQIFENANQ